jgi:predicted RNA methylase
MILEIEKAPFPTASEFKEFIRHNYPSGFSGFDCLDAGSGGTAINTYSMVELNANHVIAIDINQESLNMARAAIEKNVSEEFLL